MIDSFTGKYRFLSNFYPCQIEFEGANYPSTEHAYQAAKTTVEQLRLSFMEPIVTAGEARKLGQRLKVRDDWEQVKVQVMLDVLREKFKQQKFRQLLLATDDEELVEGNWWGDRFWGVCDGKGENLLGKLLMKVRAEIQEEIKAAIGNINV